MQREKWTPMGARIAAGMISAGIRSESDLARRIRVSHQTVRRWLYDPLVRVDAATLFRLSDTLKLSGRWIVHGEGSPSVRVAIPPTAQRLIELYEQLPPEDQDILLHAATDLVTSRL